jgi:hypothetical protein
MFIQEFTARPKVMVMVNQTEQKSANCGDTYLPIKRAFFENYSVSQIPTNEESLMVLDLF